MAVTAGPPTVLVSVELPATGSSPAAARRHVRAALRTPALQAVVDDVLLLVTELVTNAVVHAGTAVELSLETDERGLRVEVGDRSPGSTPVVRGDADAPREGGRGLFLLDALADSWGTVHERERKAVWFRKGASTASPAASLPPAVAAPADDVAAPALGWLLALPDDLEQRLSSEQVLTELLHRLCDSLEVSEAALLVEGDRDPDTWAVAATRGAPPEPDAVADLRRAALAADGALVVQRARTLVLLRGRGGPFGAVVLEQAALEGAPAAIARIAAERLAMVLRDDRAEVAQRRQRGSLALLAEASDLFAATLDVQLAVTLAAQLVVPNLAEWSAVYAVHDRGVQLAAVAHVDEDRTATLRVALSSSAGSAFAARLARELGVQRPVFVGRAELGAVVGDLPHGDVLALPLVARRRVLGGLLVARPDGVSYTAEEVGLLLDLARRAALAVDNARLYEERTSIAQALQASLLPPALPSPAEADFGARYHPAGEGNEVGGDFYDVFTLPDGGWAIAIGDVCGKGAEAAAITGLARNVVRLLAREGRPPAQVLRALNDAVLELGERGRFCTAALALVRPRPDGGLALTWCSGGHPPPVLVARGQPPSFVGRSGTVLGVVEAPELQDEQILLPPGAALVLYTDGVTERRNGPEMFGEQLLLDVLAGASGRSADDVAGRLELAVRRFGPEASRDDLAVLVVRATGVAAPVRPRDGAEQRA